VPKAAVKPIRVGSDLKAADSLHQIAGGFFLSPRPTYGTNMGVVRAAHLRAWGQYTDYLDPAREFTLRAVDGAFIGVYTAAYVASG